MNAEIAAPSITNREVTRASFATRSLRSLRSLHKWLGVPLAIVIITSGTTGLVLGWKKQIFLLQPTTAHGESTDLRTWLPIYDLEQIGRLALADRLGVPDPDTLTINRLDIRPRRGVVKVRFVRNDWEVQVDGTSGIVYSIARRHADWIERIHDGSIVGEWFKLMAMNILGVVLVILTFTGVWLWAGPIYIRRRRGRR